MKRLIAAAGVGVAGITTAALVAINPTTSSASCSLNSNPPKVIAAGSSWDAAYQAAQSGDTITVPAGSYGAQTIGYRNWSGCVKFNVTGAANLSKLEIHGPGFWVDGRSNLNVTGYIDTEADSATNHPSNVTVENAHTTSFGVFNADNVTFRNLDVGPGTVTTGCAEKEGPGIENKIGSAGGVVYNPTNVTLDGLRIHDQNGDSGRIASDCHFGGLFLAGVNGLTVKNTVFQGNVVYHVQIQSINGAPVQNVTFDHDSFGCAADWLYNGAGCDGQASIQFDGTYPGVTISNTAYAGGLYGCYAGVCDYSNDTFTGNVGYAAAIPAPPLIGGGTGTLPTTTVSTTTASTTTAPTTTTSSGPSNSQLRDAAVAELKKTTVGYINKSWKTPPPGSHWANALDFLSQIK